MFVNLSVIFACLLMAFGWLFCTAAEDVSTCTTSRAFSVLGFTMFTLGLTTGSLFVLGYI